MITVVVLALLLGLGVPTMMNAAEKRETISAAEEIYSQLQFARSESVARSQQVFANVQGGATWAIGISTDPACDPTDNMPACTLPDVDGANQITYLFGAADYDDISITTTTNQIVFSPQRATASAATINITSTGSIGYTMRVDVGLLGQITMCSPNGVPAAYVSGYRPC